MAPGITLAHLTLRDVVSDAAAKVNGAVTDANNVKHTISSWDACMSESYCKYPVIIGIIIAVLVVVSVVWCVIRCCCCGLSCCCSCFSCFNSCCKPHGRSRKRGGSNQGMSRLSSNQHMAAPAMRPQFTQQQSFGGMSTATFDASSSKKTNNGNLHEDALPAMPSWHTATEKRILDESAANDDIPESGVDKSSIESSQKQGLLAAQPPRAHAVSPSPSASQYSAGPGPAYRPQYPPSAAAAAAPQGSTGLAAGYYNPGARSASPAQSALYDGYRPRTVSRSPSAGQSPYAASPYGASQSQNQYPQNQYSNQYQSRIPSAGPGARAGPGAGYNSANGGGSYAYPPPQQTRSYSPAPPSPYSAGQPQTPYAAGGAQAQYSRPAAHPAGHAAGGYQAYTQTQQSQQGWRNV